MTGHRRVYTLDEARSLLPEIRATLLQLAVERRRHLEAHEVLHAQLRSDSNGAAPGEQHGATQRGAQQRGAEERVAEIEAGIKALVDLLEERGIQLRDLDEGLIDIPTERDGEPAWFCWRLSDPELGFWHTTREGYANRKPV